MTSRRCCGPRQRRNPMTAMGTELVTTSDATDDREKLESWRRTHAAYWDSVAGFYDGLYTGTWSSAEDAAVVERLRAQPLKSPSVLDLGCGTGLGYEMVVAAFGEITYHGRDISAAMLEVFHRRHPNLMTSLGPMEDLGDLQDESFDLVTAFSTAASYAADTNSLLREAHRVLKPSGLLYLSVLSRISLRRLIRGRFRASEVYRTRNEHSTSDGVPARAFTRAAISAELHRIGFEPERIDSQGTLSGLIERTALWRLSRLADAHLRSLGHTLEVVARRKDDSE